MPKPRTLHDEFFLKAKQEGYVARSAYKLLEIQEKRRLIRRSDLVLDVGCAPGSWLQVLERNLRGGRAVGIDLSRVSAKLGDSVRTLVGDIDKTDARTLLHAVGLSDAEIDAGRRFDVVLSDMAPSTSGHGDDFLSARLCERVLDLLPEVLAPNGNALLKILEGEPTPAVVARMKASFRAAGTTKPKASRDVSREIFLWGEGFLLAKKPDEAVVRASRRARVGGWVTKDGADAPDATKAPAPPATPATKEAPAKRAAAKPAAAARAKPAKKRVKRTGRTP